MAEEPIRREGTRHIVTVPAGSTIGRHNGQLIITHPEHCPLIVDVLDGTVTIVDPVAEQPRNERVGQSPLRELDSPRGDPLK